MKKWEQTRRGDSILVLCQNKDTIIGYVEHGKYLFQEYQPTTYCPPFVMCVEDPISEEATYTIDMNLVSKSDTIVVGYMWRCYRNEYKIMFANSIYSAHPKIYDFTNQVESYNYNAIFDLLPDTITIEDGPVTTTIVANMGITEIENRWTNERWEMIY